VAAVQARAAGVSGEELEYRACTTEEDFRQCVRLQKTIWNFEDEDLLPLRLFIVAYKIGGQNFGAFESDGRMAGFLLAIPGLRHGKPYFHSHMLGVLPEYRNRRVGRRLKLMQRDDALEQGIALVEWTFDPLELKNAFFNIERLGAVVRRYVPNQYGTSSSILQGGLPTDRLVAEWWVATERTRAITAGEPRPSRAERRIELPADIGEIKQRDRRRALDIQARARDEFLAAFDAGYTVTGFDPGGTYLLEKLTNPEQL